jgi:acylphosphatase
VRDGPKVVRKRLLVTGRVQGVFYRVTCRREAEARGVAGSAQNLPDGSVEVILEGERAMVEEMISWCRKGPAHARVEDVQIFDEPPEGNPGFF